MASITYPWTPVNPNQTLNPWFFMSPAIKTYLRISDPYNKFGGEIEENIDAACADLANHGIIAARLWNVNDALIKRAIILYCKANFGLDNPDSVKYQASYEALRDHLMLSSEYITEPEEDDSEPDSGSGASIDDGPGSVIDHPGSLPDIGGLTRP